MLFVINAPCFLNSEVEDYAEEALEPESDAEDQFLPEIRFVYCDYWFDLIQFMPNIFCYFHSALLELKPVEEENAEAITSYLL